MGKIMMFHGRECPHCRKMMPLVDRLIQEEKFEVEKYEVWHDEKNADLMRSHGDVIKSKCGGQLRVPTFLKPETGEAVCGEMEYDRLRDWAGA